MRRWRPLLPLGLLLGCSAAQDPGSSEVQRVAPSGRVSVVLPALASSAVRLASPHMSVGFRLRGARRVVGRAGEGTTRFAAAAPGGGDVWLRASSTGVEDFVALPEPVGFVDYELDVTAVAGLRLVSNVLELLDASGTPRWRVARPYLVGADGQRSWAELQLFDCDADRDPRAPWGRPVVAPGASRCSLRVTWEGVRFPAVLDPVWSTTGNLSGPRRRHGSALLENGRVLVAGGYDPNDDKLSTAELYDPLTGSWAMTGSLNEARANFGTLRLNDGTVLVAGGYPPVSGDPELASAELYDAQSGSFSATGSMTRGRSWFGLSLLADGRVLVSGGGEVDDAAAELYDPASASWSATGSMAAGRSGHTSTLLSDGRVLVAGGSYESSAELYDPSTASWSSAGTLRQSRSSHTATRLASGDVLVVGGTRGATLIAEAEAFSPVTGVWNVAGALNELREEHVAALLPSGLVLVAAGRGDGPNGGQRLSSAEVYEPSSKRWLPTSPLAEPRIYAGGSRLLDGRVLLSGGSDLSSAELFEQATVGERCATCGDCATAHCSEGVCSGTGSANGRPCVCDQGCASGFCVDGVCCNEVCDGTCRTCRGDEQADGADGNCGPVAANTDPVDECTAGSVTACSAEPVCDGAGACTCEQQGAASCDGNHTLSSAVDSQDCSPYRCASDPARCLTECTSTAQCIDGWVCDTASATCRQPTTDAPGPGEEPGGCGCRAVRSPGWHPASLLAFAGLGLLLLARGRRAVVSG